MQERTRRAEKMADLIRQELSELMEHKLKDPRVGFVTITGVELFGDLRVARVSVSILGDEEQRKQSLKGLEAAKNFLRYQLAQQLRLRHTPAVEFQLDRTLESEERIEELLRRVREES